MLKRWFGSLAVVLIALAGCSRDDELQRILARGEISVVTRNAPTTWYSDRDGQAGFEYEMVEAFADHLGVNVSYVIEDTVTDILQQIQTGKAAFAAAGLTRTVERENGFIFGPTYQTVRQQVVCRRGGATPKSAADLPGLSIHVAADSSYVEQLQQLKTTTPTLEWQADSELDTEALLEQVWLKKIDCTIADSNIVEINRRYYPELSVRFSISDEQQLAWVLPAESQALQQEINKWFETFKASGKLAKLHEKYYGFIEVFDFVDNRAFNRRIDERLPKYKSAFIKASNKYKLDWQLLAAQSYQESHWNPRAKSPTGVRGMMMLTLITAKELGVKSRLNPEQSIFGGAKYFSRLRKRLPESVEEPDRTWMALAAYNVGMGHLYDARKLAVQLGKNRDSWQELSEVLPLLAQKRYYKKLKYGYARGREPVLYVQRIRDYHDILQQRMQEKAIASSE